MDASSHPLPSVFFHIIHERLRLGLALLLAMGCQWALPLKAQADLVYLHAATDVYQVQTTNDYPVTAWEGLATQFIRYKNDYAHGVGLTSEGHEHYAAKFLYNDTNGMSRWEGAPDHTALSRTNTFTCPWLGWEQGVGLYQVFDVWVNISWLPEGTNWITTTNTFPNGYTNSNWPGPSTYGSWGYYSGADYDYTQVTGGWNASTNTTTTTIQIVHTVNLLTSAPSNTTGSALFKLTSGFGIYGATNANVLADYAGAYTLAGQSPDINGVVWKTFADGSTHDVSVRIRDAYTNAVTNFTFQPTATRVELTGLKWRGPNDTNWAAFSGPLHVLVGTTVEFQVQANETNVNWPATMPAWSNGSNRVEQIAITFNTVSADTNGQWISVTAGNTVSNQVVVFDYEVKFQPAEGPGRFEGRETYPTGYGVGETVDFVAAFMPDGVTVDNLGGVDWTVTGMYYDSSYLGDLSVTNATSITLGAFEETDQVTGTLLGGVSAGASRNAQFSSWRPKAAILKDLMVTTMPNVGPLFAWPHLGHNSNTISCFKRAAYFLQPQTNSYHGIRVRESTGLYNYSNGSNSIVNNINTTQITFTLTNAAGTVTAGPHTVTFMANPANHAIGGWSYPLNLAVTPGGAIEKSFWGIDKFGSSKATEAGILPNSADHVPVILTTLSVPIVIEFKHATDDIYYIATVTSKRDYYSTGRMEIEKKTAGVGSGPHSKEFTDGTTIE